MASIVFNNSESKIDDNFCGERVDKKTNLALSEKGPICLKCPPNLSVGDTCTYLAFAMAFALSRSQPEHFAPHKIPSHVLIYNDVYISLTVGF